MLAVCQIYFHPKKQYTASEFADDNWDEEFMPELGPVDKLLHPDSDSEEGKRDEDPDQPVRLTCFKSFSEAITCLEDIRDFLEDRGCTAAAANDSNIHLDSLAELQCITRQTSTTDYIS